MRKESKIDMLQFEKMFSQKGHTLIAGVDEVGRGCLAGPVVAAAVVFPAGFDAIEINDSKQLTPFKRDEAFEIIIKNALSYAAYSIPVSTIDRINILKASLAAMMGAINRLSPEPEFILIDGNRAPEKLMIPFKCIVKGDQKSRSVAAASIVAKVIRDRLMTKLDKLYPEYKFKSNKGYGTAAHLTALNKIGPTPHHRYSFSPVRQLAFKFE
ncbi:MAG: ribonuclease HII [Calditrichaeota bacterium]|nr:ribonuclease HII [Calditrichota bacterium]